MFPVWIKGGQAEKPAGPIYYILAQNGFFISKKMKFWKAIVPVENISILEPETPSIELFLPPIPEAMTHEIATFLAWVYQTHGTEAIITLHYNDREQKYRAYAPKQEVAYGHVSYSTPESLPGEALIGTFHSHCNMSAFHSNTDQHDEGAFDGLHGVFGGFSRFNNSQNFELSLQIVVNGARFPLKPEEHMLGLKKNEENRDEKPSWYRPWQASEQFMLAGESVLWSKYYTPPEEWMGNLTIKTTKSWLLDTIPRGYPKKTPTSPIRRNRRK